MKATAEKKIYPSGDYSIRGSDIDPEMIRIAEGNARRAGVAGDITFSVGNYLDIPGSRHSALEKVNFDEVRREATLGYAESLEMLNPVQHDESEKSIIITNPPYGNRLQSEDLDDIYKKLIHEVSEHG